MVLIVCLPLFYNEESTRTVKNLDPIKFLQAEGFGINIRTNEVSSHLVGLPNTTLLLVYKSNSP